MDDEFLNPHIERTAILYPDEQDLPRPRRHQPQHPPKQPKYWKRRLLVGLSLLVVLGLIGAAGSALYLQSRLGGVKKVYSTSLTAAAGPMNVLLVGSDSRAELAPGEAVHFGSGEQVGGKRSDAIMILHADPRQSRASVLSIPRDLFVPIAGTGHSNRINSAYAGGPDRLIQTIQDALGIPINHYVEVNFDGFRGIVDAIGGLNVPFSAPARDTLSELKVATAGCVHLTGAQGLAYVRSRHYQFLENGKWKTDPTSDLGRIQRQQDFIRRMIKKAISKGIRNPATANKLLGSFVQNVTVDSALGTSAMIKLGNQFRSLAGGDLQMLTLPTVPARIGGADVLKTKQPEASQTIDKFLNPPPAATTPAPAPVTPSSVRIQVLNGSGRTGEAALAAAKLQSAGFVVAGTGDAPALTTGNQIRFAKGAESKAQLLQSLVLGGVQVQSDASIKDSDLILVTGKGFGGIRAGTAAATPAQAASPPAATPAAPECLA